MEHIVTPDLHHIALHMPLHKHGALAHGVHHAIITQEHMAPRYALICVKCLPMGRHVLRGSRIDDPLGGAGLRGSIMGHKSKVIVYNVRSCVVGTFHASATMASNVARFATLEARPCLVSNVGAAPIAV